MALRLPEIQNLWLSLVVLCVHASTEPDPLPFTGPSCSLNLVNLIIKFAECGGRICFCAYLQGEHCRGQSAYDRPCPRQSSAGSLKRHSAPPGLQCGPGSRPRQLRGGAFRVARQHAAAEPARRCAPDVSVQRSACSSAGGRHCR